MCCFHSAGHVPPPTRHPGSELLVASRIVSLCKLGTSSSHPQMTERSLNILSGEGKKTGVWGCGYMGVCVCVRCVRPQSGEHCSEWVFALLKRFKIPEYALFARKQIYISNCRKISRMYMTDLVKKTFKAESL